VTRVERDITRFVDRIRSFFGRATDKRNPQLRAMGAKAIEIIVRRSRLGYGVKKVESLRYRFPPLSDRYIAFRKDHRGELHRFGRPAKSNITATGQLLESMQYRIEKRRRTQVIVGPSGRRRASSFDDGSLSNEEVAENLAKGGRIYNNLSRPEIAQLRNFYRRSFGDLVKRKLS